MPARHRPLPPRTSRFWSIPGALGFGPEPFECAAILDEMADDLAVLIWQMLRDVDLLLSVENGRVRGLFAREAAGNRARLIEAVGPCDPAVRDVLAKLAEHLGNGGAASDVSAACAALARWASEAGYERTAFAAALRAAAASPHDAAYSYLAGLMARRAADYVRAEAWLKRARAVALRTADARHYGLSLMSLANLHMQRFEGDLAKRRLRQALNAARRFGVWDLRPLAYHDLFIISTTHGTRTEAARYALAAARGYGRFHPRLPALAHDLAWFLLLQGRPARALRILQAMDDRSLRASERLLRLSTIARAAGAAGERQVFWQTWSEFWQWLDTVPSQDRAAEALVNLGWGAASLCDATRLEVAAREALRIAGPREEGQEIEAAEAMLTCLEEGRFPNPPTPAAGSDEEIADALAAAEMLIDQLMQAPALTDPAITTGRSL